MNWATLLQLVALVQQIIKALAGNQAMASPEKDAKIAKAVADLDAAVNS